MLIRCNGGACHVLLNQNEVKFEAKRISFNVIIFEPTPMNPIYKVYQLIHSSNAMIVGLNGWWRFAMQDWLGMWGSE